MSVLLVENKDITWMKYIYQLIPAIYLRRLDINWHFTFYYIKILCVIVISRDATHASALLACTFLYCNVTLIRKQWCAPIVIYKCYNFLYNLEYPEVKIIHMTYYDDWQDLKGIQSQFVTFYAKQYFVNQKKLILHEGIWMTKSVFE